MQARLRIKQSRRTRATLKRWNDDNDRERDAVAVHTIGPHEYYIARHLNYFSMRPWPAGNEGTVANELTCIDGFFGTDSQRQ